MLADAEVGPLENIVVAEIVADEKVVLKYFKEIDSADLFFELRAIVENDVFAILRQFRQ